MLTLAIYTDDDLLAHGDVYFLQQTEDIGIDVICNQASKLVETVHLRRPHMLLLDLCPEINLSVIGDVRKACPDCKVILWARDVPQELAYQAMTLGIRGILKRTLPGSELVRCLRKVARNDVWFDEALTGGFLGKRVTKLTRRESELVHLLSRGLKNKEIAYRLSLTEGTVKVYLSRLFEKLGVKDRFELALYGLQNLSSSSVFGIPGDRSEACLPCPSLPLPLIAALDLTPTESQNSIIFVCSSPRDMPRGQPVLPERKPHFPAKTYQPTPHAGASEQKLSFDSNHEAV